MYRIHGVFYRVTFSAESEKETFFLMKSRCLATVLHSNNEKITVIYFISFSVCNKCFHSGFPLSLVNPQ